MNQDLVGFDPGSVSLVRLWFSVRFQSRSGQVLGLVRAKFQSGSRQVVVRFWCVVNCNRFPVR